MFKGRYVIYEVLGEGSFGAVHQVVDVQNPEHKLIAKIQSDKDVYTLEATFLNEVKQKFKKDLKEYVKVMNIEDDTEKIK